MRMLIKATIPVEAGNALVKNGTLGATIQKIMAHIKPEAAYFVAADGQRTGIFIVDLQKASDIPGIAEPLFLALGASIEAYPCMIPEDLGAAVRDIERAAKEFGS